MPKKFISVLSLAFAIGLSACAGQTAVSETPPEYAYNAELAEELGADEYGMRSYVMVVLKTGPEDKNITDEDRRKELFAGHFSNMGTWAKEDKLVLAGPFIEGGDKRGLYIFNTPSLDTAKAWVLADPAVAAGIFTPEFTKYYGSAALMKINDLHSQIQKTKIE